MTDLVYVPLVESGGKVSLYIPFTQQLAFEIYICSERTCLLAVEALQHDKLCLQRQACNSMKWLQNADSSFVQFSTRDHTGTSNIPASLSNLRLSTFRFRPTPKARCFVLWWV